MFLVTAEEMRDIEKEVVEKIGISNGILMENAGASVSRKIRERVRKELISSVIVLSGHGNNGGDGFVIARHLGNSGYNVETWLIGDENRLSQESKTNLYSLIKCGYKLKVWSDENFDTLKESMANADVIIDSMLGTGINGKLRDPYKAIVEYANQLDILRVAVDIPTGVNCNNGQVEENAFRAEITITFTLPKVGQLLYPGAGYVGELLIEDISIPPIIINKLNLKNNLITSEMVKNLLPVRSLISHKGTYGHALLIGGSKNMPGAPALATKAALSVGAGLATIAVPKSIQSLIFDYIPEAIHIGLPEQSSGNISLDSLEILSDNINTYSAISFGMGIGCWDEGEHLLHGILDKFENPLLIDADGLNILSNNLNVLNNRKYPTILTPHPGEMTRLIKRSIEYVQQNRVTVAKDLAINYGIYVVLKGANTIITTPDGEVYINQTGGPELAKGGTGDVLSGMITGYISQKLPITEAIIIAVYIHGLSGSLVANSVSNHSVLASEVVNNIGPAIYRLISNHVD